MTTPPEALEVVRRAIEHAAGIGVDLVVEWQDEQRRLTFDVTRTTGARGAGADAVATLTTLADEADLPISIDVTRGSPDLVRYYWRFGFRLHDGTIQGEIADHAALTRERNAFLSRPGRTEDDYGVVTMWRDRHAGPLHAEAANHRKTT